MIYVVRCALTNRVKIGFSEKPWSRFVKIQVDCPTELTLVAAFDGDKEGESDLHRRFAEQRLRGEWFSESGSLKAFIATLPAPKRPLTRRKLRALTSGSPLGEWIAANSLTDAAVSNATGISRPTICRLRRGKRNPGMDVARKLSALTGIPWFELFPDDGVDQRRAAINDISAERAA